MFSASPGQIEAEFIRWVRIPAGLAVQVCRIEWDGPYTSHSHWETFQILPLQASVSKQQSALQRLRRRKKYFGTCRDCGEWQPSGWMHDARICQGCAPHYGVIY